MPGVGNDGAATTAAADSQSNDVPSSTNSENTCVKPTVAVATPSEAASHEAAQLQVSQDHTAASDGVNLADVDHVQTVVTVQQPPTSYEYHPGCCPICGDRISGLLALFLTKD